MTATAVIVLNTLARDEFERDWHGFDEPLSFIDGGEEPVETLSCTIGDEVVTFQASDVAKAIRDTDASARYEVEELAEALAEHDVYLTDEQIDEKVAAKVQEFWIGQLDSENETMATFQCQLDYAVASFKEFIDYSNMICERLPELAPHIAERIEQVHAEIVEALQL